MIGRHLVASKSEAMLASSLLFDDGSFVVRMCQTGDAPSTTAMLIRLWVECHTNDITQHTYCVTATKRYTFDRRRWSSVSLLLVGLSPRRDNALCAILVHMLPYFYYHENVLVTRTISTFAWISYTDHRAINRCCFLCYINNTLSPYSIRFLKPLFHFHIDFYVFLHGISNSQNISFFNQCNITTSSLLLTDVTRCLWVSPTVPDIIQWGTSWIDACLANTEPWMQVFQNIMMRRVCIISFLPAKAQQRVYSYQFIYLFGIAICICQSNVNDWFNWTYNYIQE